MIFACFGFQYALYIQHKSCHKVLDPYSIHLFHGKLLLPDPFSFLFVQPLLHNTNTVQNLISSDSNSHRLSEEGYDARLRASSLTFRISSILSFRGSANSTDSFNCLPFSCGTILLTEVIFSCNSSSPFLACNIEFWVFSHCA